MAAGWFSGAARWPLGRLGRGGGGAVTAGGVFRRAARVTRVFGRARPGRVFARAAGVTRVFRGDPRMSQILQTTLPKDADESVGYVFDFSRFPEARAGETLASCSVPSVSGLTIGTPAVLAAPTDGVPAGRGVQVTIGGGTAAAGYVVECRGTFSGGSVRVVKGALEVE